MFSSKRSRISKSDSGAEKWSIYKRNSDCGIFKRIFNKKMKRVGVSYAFVKSNDRFEKIVLFEIEI